MSGEPDWLTWTRELQAIAQTGLTFARDPYDRERYEMLRDLASRIMAQHTTGITAAAIADLFSREQGYATPKIDVRTAAFDAEGRMLMVREVQDAGRWTLPGGWADVNLTPAENAAKEVVEESGFEVRISKLAAVWDRTRQGHTPAVFACAKLFFVAEITGGAPAASLETSEVGFFARGDMPADLSIGRVLPNQLARMFAHHDDPSLPTDWE
ncbi:MAG: NUDIX hydrolase N-terminal domain-containing protein [Acidisphaera sp.]|nr:NUDIX hydrolase N-terminal domain-containing protein [Acidisphaera sp.]MBV9813032.1 NUDIX hydrolase N-terminal domain-containing protein [Acetobacteraceae bacterium]